jgi:hypothetical protein
MDLCGVCGGNGWCVGTGQAMRLSVPVCVCVCVCVCVESGTQQRKYICKRTNLITGQSPKIYKITFQT